MGNSEGPWSPLTEVETQACGASGPLLRRGHNPLSVIAKRNWLVGEGFGIAALPLVCYSTMTPCFFFHRLFWLWNSNLKPIAVYPCLYLCSKPQFLASVLLHNRWLRTKAGVHSALVKTCMQFLLCLAFHKLLSSPLIHWKSFSVTVDFPLCEDFLDVADLSFPPGFVGSFFDSSSFCLTLLWRDFSCPLRCSDIFH